MQNYPVFIQLEQRPVLVVGGNDLARQKAEGLVASGAHVWVVDRHPCQELLALEAQGGLRCLLRDFVETDLEGKLLVITCSDDPELNARIYRMASERQQLVNSHDDPPNCNFITPAITRRGPLEVAVSSQGTSPALAQELRRKIAEEILKPELGELAKLLGSWRDRVKAQVPSFEARAAFWRDILATDIASTLSEQGRESAEQAIARQLENCSAEGAWKRD